MNPLYTVSIACHNLRHLTQRCLESVLASRAADRLEIIVTDNASDDQTYEYLESLTRQAPVGTIRQDTNVGFGRAHNAALFYAKGTYFVVLNNDTVVPPDWLDRMRQCFLDDPQVGIVGVNGTCKHLNSLGVGGDGAGEPDYVEASCLMIPTFLARRETLFDPAYRFAYAEDADLSLRLRRRGYHIAHADVTIRHQVASTASLVRRQGVDLDGFHAVNHARLVSRWGHYLRSRNLQVNNNLVIRRTDAIGDLLMLTPVLHAMKQEEPHRKLVVITSCSAVLRDNPSAEAATRAASIDHDLDLCYECQPSLHPTDAFAKALSVRSCDRRPHIYPNPAERQWAKQVMPDGKWCVIHPNIGQDSHSWPGRNWPVDNFNLVAHRLVHDYRGCCPGFSSNSDWRIAVVGSANAPTLPEAKLDLRGRTTLHQLAAIIERASLFVGVDSAPMHLARAALIPTVAVFGSISPTLRLSPYPFECGVTANPMKVGCLGCHHVYEPPRTNGHCIRDREYCMDRLMVEQVFDAIPMVLEARMTYLETSKVRDRILPYLKGRGIDVGCGRDPITQDCVALDRESWPEVTHQGDARKLSFKDEEFDWLHSSHCLEDLADTEAALAEWLRVIRRSGVISLYVPHPDLYAKTGMVNLDHLHPGFTPQELTDLLERLNTTVLVAEVDEGDNRYSTLVIGRKR